MMKRKFIAVFATAMLAFSACTEDTESIGTSVTNQNDILIVGTDTFNIPTRTITVDSVLSKNYNCYFGKIKDPETKTYITSNFMAQFNMINPTVANIDSIKSYNGGQLKADSCRLYLVFNENDCYGDSLAAMKMRVTELSKPVEDGKIYYSNYDPAAEGLLREDGIRKNLMFTQINRNIPQHQKDSLKSASSYSEFLTVPLNDEYIAIVDGKKVTYPSYGDYLLTTYFEHPEYFKNSYNFIHNVCPGFYFEIIDGMGLMTRLQDIQLEVDYSFMGDTAKYSGYILSISTEEVVQTTNVINDRQRLQELAEDNSCTYIKSPSGLFTEVTLPVTSIMQGHENDSILSAAISFQRINNVKTADEYTLDIPKNIVMVQKDSLYNFFEKNKLTDSRISYTASYSSTANAYTFSNISGLIAFLNQQRAKGIRENPNWEALHPDWNKVVLVPVALTETTTSSSYYSTTTTVTQITNDMSMSSTKLVGGDTPIKLSVVYTKFDHR